MADLIRTRIKITPTVEFIARYRYFRVVEGTRSFDVKNNDEISTQENWDD